MWLIASLLMLFPMYDVTRRSNTFAPCGAPCVIYYSWILQRYSKHVYAKSSVCNDNTCIGSDTTCSLCNMAMRMLRRIRSVMYATVVWYRCLWNTHSFEVSLCPATLQQKLISCQWIGIRKAYISELMMLWRNGLFTDTSIWRTPHDEEATWQMLSCCWQCHLISLSLSLYLSLSIYIYIYIYKYLHTNQRVGGVRFRTSSNLRGSEQVPKAWGQLLIYIYIYIYIRICMCIYIYIYIYI